MELEGHSRLELHTKMDGPQNHAAVRIFERDVGFHAPEAGREVATGQPFCIEFERGNNRASTVQS